MLKSCVPVVLITASFLLACGNNPQKSANTEGSPAEAEGSYFPVTGFIHSQLTAIDSLQLPVTKYEAAGDKKDTVALSTADCRLLAAPFLEYDITAPPLKEKFRETSFADQSIPSITFTYHTDDSTLALKRVDVVLAPDPVQADKVKSVYMEKLFQQQDTLVEEKLYWKANHFYQLIRSKKVANGQPIISQLKVVWDPTE